MKMGDKTVDELPRAEITSSRKSENSNERQQPVGFLKTPSMRSSAFSESFVENEQLGKTSSLSRTIGEKIKSSLPNFGQHIRRFMKLKSHRGIQNEESTPDATVAMTSFDHHDLTKLRQADEEDINDANTSRSFEKDPQKSRSNFNEFAVVPPVPLVSDSLSDLQTSEFSMESDARIPGILDETVAPMNRLTISSAAEARLDESFDQLNLQNIISENGAIIAGDPIAFAAALNAQLGYDRIRTYAELEARRENEPRSIPLLFFQDTSNDSFLGSSTSAVTGSSASGSENSSVNGVSEVMEDEESSSSGRRTDDERDEARQYYDAARRATLRKQFRHFDDEPPIY